MKNSQAETIAQLVKDVDELKGEIARLKAQATLKASQPFGPYGGERIVSAIEGIEREMREKWGSGWDPTPVGPYPTEVLAKYFVETSMDSIPPANEEKNQRRARLGRIQSRFREMQCVSRAPVGPDGVQPDGYMVWRSFVRLNSIPFPASEATQALVDLPPTNVAPEPAIPRGRKSQEKPSSGV